MKKIAISALIFTSLLSLNGMAQSKCCKSKKCKNNQTMELKTELDSVSYGLGVNIAQSLKQQGITEIEMTAFSKGLEDMLAGNDLKLDEAKIGELLNTFMQKKAEEKSAGVIEEGKAYLVKNGKRPEVTTLPSGLQYEIIEKGTGAIPTAADNVTTHYTGMLIDGTVFDSSVERGQPATFPVGGVIKGWTEALQLMPTGSKWKLHIPYDLAYGERGAGAQIGPYATLVFDIELISIGK